MGGDYFKLNIVGYVNGKKVSYRSEFIYSDLSFLNFPSENDEYGERIKGLFKGAIEHILTIDKNKF